MMNVMQLLAVFSLTVLLAGCEKSQESPVSKEDPKPAASNPPMSSKADTAPKVEPGHDGRNHPDENKPTAPGAPSKHSGELIELGTKTIAAFQVRAARDKGDIKPGGDAPVDIWIDEGLGKGIAAVRLWIGAEDARGSIKAKAGIEDEKWHVHLEVPDPLPSESELWVEIESENGDRETDSFPLQF